MGAVIVYYGATAVYSAARWAAPRINRKAFSSYAWAKTARNASLPAE
jgi:hypothetical protein